MAATLIAEVATLSHASAAALWRIRPDLPPGAPIHVTVPMGSGRRRRRGLVIHSAADPIETKVRDRIPVTTVPRTILDCAASLAPRAVERMLDEAERLRLCRERDLRTIIAAHPHRPGTRRLAAVLASHDAGSTRTRSELEELFLALCRRAGLPQPLVNQRLLGCEADFLWPGHRLVVETDGRGSHLTARGFQADRERDARLAAAGYQVLRFTWRDVTERPALVADRVRAVLQLREQAGAS